MNKEINETNKPIKYCYPDSFKTSGKKFRDKKKSLGLVKLTTSGFITIESRNKINAIKKDNFKDWQVFINDIIRKYEKKIGVKKI